MTGLRERNKALRVEAILDAAVELLDTADLDELTTDRIAAHAGVATATVYNLVGTRDRLLRAVIDRIVERLVEQVADASARDEDPIAVAHLIVDHSVAAFTEHSMAYRRIVAAGRSVGNGHLPDIADPSSLQVAALRRAQEQGILRDDVDVAGLGRQIYISWIGAMEHWANGRLSDDGFAVATRHGLLTVLVAAATDAERARFDAELADLGPVLERHWTTRH
ncbi:MAG: TetR/AcrR family transcriptional regulator [Actinomycetota bacterium]